MIAGKYRRERLRSHWTKKLQGFCGLPTCWRSREDLEPGSQEQGAGHVSWLPVHLAARSKVLAMWADYLSTCPVGPLCPPSGRQTEAGANHDKLFSIFFILDLLLQHSPEQTNGLGYGSLCGPNQNPNMQSRSWMVTDEVKFIDSASAYPVLYLPLWLKIYYRVGQKTTMVIVNTIL